MSRYTCKACGVTHRYDRSWHKISPRRCGKCERLGIPEATCINRNRTTMKCRKSCCRNMVDPQPNDTRQFQLGWNGIGDFCELGCCDFSDKHARHSCPRPKIE